AIGERVAAEAPGGEPGRRIDRPAMRVVAGRAGHPAALEEAAGLPQTVGLVRDLELVVVAASGRVIEVDAIGGEVLSRTEGEHPPAERDEAAPVRAAGRLEVALHADVHLTLPRQPSWIDDARAHLRERGALRARQPDVTLPGTVTALTVDPGGQILGED